MDEKKREKQIPTVELGGRLWELRFGHKAMRLFCGAVECSLSSFDLALDSYDNQTLLLWCILQVQDSSVTKEVLDDWLDALLLEDIFDLIQDAIAAAMPSTAGKKLNAMEDEDADEAENPTPETSSGTV